MAFHHRRKVEKDNFPNRKARPSCHRIERVHCRNWSLTRSQPSNYKNKNKIDIVQKGQRMHNIYGGACVQDHNYNILKMCKCRGDVTSTTADFHESTHRKLNILQARLYTNTLHVYDHVAAKSWHPPPEVAVTI